MALVLMEGFDHMTAAEFTSKGWTSNPNAMAAGRFGGQAGGFRNQAALKALPGSYSTIIAGFAINYPSGPQTGNAFIFQASGSTIMIQAQDTSGHIVIKTGAGSTVATGTTVMTATNWYYVEIELVIAGAAGSVTVQLNGAPEIPTTTGNFGSSPVTTVALNSPYTTVNLLYDDLYVLETTTPPNTAFLGDSRIITLPPSAAGSHSAWSPLASTNVSQVDETLADGDTSYNFFSTVGGVDTFPASPLPAGATIYGVQTNLYARKDNAGGVRQVADVIYQGGTTYVGQTDTLGSGYSFFSNLYNQDPTGSNWVGATFNADEFGYELVA